MRGWILTAVLAGCLSFADSNAHAGIVDAINSKRVTLGLGKLSVGVDSTTQRIARSVASSNQTRKSYFQDRDAAISQNCRCLVPTDRGRDYDGKDPSEMYEKETGIRSAGFWTTRAGWSLNRRLRFAPQLAALIFDPRARKISVTSRGGTEVLSVMADLTADPLERALLVSPRSHNPEGRMPLIFVSGGPMPKMFAERRSGRRWVNEERLMGTRFRPSPDGFFDRAHRAVIPELAPYGGFPLLAWGSRYRIRTPKQTFVFRTTRVPKGGHLRYKRSSRGFRRYFEAAIRAGHPFARRMLAQIAGTLSVATHGGSDTISGAGANGVDMYRGHLTGSVGLRNHITWHELGHVFDYSPSLSLKERSKFVRLFKRSPRWRGCFLGQTVVGPGCAPRSEIFADQIAFWATGNRRQRSGYNVPPLAPRSVMTKLIRKLWVPRPSVVDYGVDTASS